MLEQTFCLKRLFRFAHITDAKYREALIIIGVNEELFNQRSGKNIGN